MPILPLALVTSTVLAPYFVVAALCVFLLSSGCIGFCALAERCWPVGFELGLIHGLRWRVHLFSPAA